VCPHSTYSGDISRKPSFFRSHLRLKKGHVTTFTERRTSSFAKISVLGTIEQSEQVTAPFNMKPSQYAKAILYKDIGVFNEPLNQRRAH